MPQEAFIVYDARAQNLVLGSPFPSKEAAEEHADRHAKGQPEGLVPVYEVFAVRADASPEPAAKI
jgi:hypothetical protein